MQPLPFFRRLALAALLIGALAPRTGSAAGLLDPAAMKALLVREAQRFARQFAPPRLAEPPAWATRADPPRATIAVLADPHYDDSGKAAWARPTRGRLAKAIRFLNATLKPQAVLLLGDIVAFGSVEQLRHAKALLDADLAAPCYTVAGNHDGPGYASVFGSPHRTFAVGGIRFVTLGLTYQTWDLGWGTCGRLDWLAEQLAAHPREPTLVLTHNPVAMPTFANNAAALALLDAQPQVLAVLAGHMHVDYEMRLAKLHLGMPMLARAPHGFKVLRVYPDAIHVVTYEDTDGAYRQAPIYQKIDIPPDLRPAAAGAEKGPP